MLAAREFALTSRRACEPNGLCLSLSAGCPRHKTLADTRLTAMSINFRCPSCGTEFLDVEDAIAGKKLRCKSCQVVFRAPLHAATPIANPETSSAGSSRPTHPPHPLVSPASLSAKPPGKATRPGQAEVLRSWNPDLRAMQRSKAAERESTVPPGFTQYKINGRRVHISDMLCIVAGALGCLDGLTKLAVLLLQLVGFSALYAAWPFFAILLVLDFILVIFYLTGTGWLVVSTIKQYGDEREEDRRAHGMARIAAFIYLGLNVFLVLWAMIFFSHYGEIFVVLLIVRVVASGIPAFVIVAVQWRFKADSDIDRDLDSRAQVSLPVPKRSVHD